jgi:hypothetical protein
MAEARETRVRVARQTARDQLGHWVAPPSQRDHPCHHACCSGYRVHPANLPVRLDRKYLRSLSDAELERELVSYQGFNDTHERGFLQIIAEAGRRDESAERRTKARDRREQRASEYRDEVYRQWFRAENGIQGGVLLNKRGIAKGIDERSLFSGSDREFDRYASDELKEWVGSHPRITRREWDRQRRAEWQEPEREAA